MKSAQASLDKLQAGATAVQLQSAEASVASAGSRPAEGAVDLAALKAGPTETDLTNAKIALEKAKIAKQNAQAAYDKIAWKPSAAASAEAMTLWQATTDYQAAEIAYKKDGRGPTAPDWHVAEQAVVSAQAQLASAEENLATLKRGPHGRRTGLRRGGGRPGAEPSWN